MHEGYKVKLDTFEGPLDLLLHLINQYEIDIYDIPVAQITQQYMEYIHTMQHLELNIASEYLVMASTLLAIKSQMLLPKQELEENLDEEYMEDPREELMQRLIEYRKYKEIAERLKEKENEEIQLYTRPPAVFEFKDVPEKVTTNQTDISIFDMIGALNKMLKRKEWTEPHDTTVQRMDIPIETRMKDVLRQVQSSTNGLVFDKLFPSPTKSYIVVTFVAVLELMKDKQIFAVQKRHFEDLYLFSMEEFT
ncbi:MULTISPECIES: segregation/condensation protein A [Oceanobacillus]|uniref:Segregation and condensation protein A n=1 Tax=Oceanobacillus kimchii TaxID=746691 RepID=A0ABQ5THY9_9BACI|nr:MULTISPECIES: segregation/condensation protein A [Oceanobacillus]MBT2598420.1 segregation/condensation protein A [Oceanobacillus sp. ISL-74]MBT2651338.1 segregation/condensation protein A [Oceanobacillus sp. ISL-73]MCT1575997.1 segregation/condensation protein A [Oceanobacillus kimchii]MCT2135634.1 segregation/condensation protein A [Oceanobacillus kimchii]OEH55734.1 segregation/condensation protein A [Oceanobacillus sp. E9]